jgi:predicted CoA-substrate-specific enzyme activase
MISVGVDIGSISTKAVALVDGRPAASRIQPTGYHAGRAAEAVYAAILSDARLSPEEVARVVTTGYGRRSAPFAHRAVTEISCHAVGARFLDPEVRTVVDVGGQDSKIILLGADGRVRDFAMNDKCAAGTGRYL